MGTWLGMQEVQRQGCGVGREIQIHAGQREGLEPGGRGLQSGLGGAGLALVGTPGGGHTGRGAACNSALGPGIQQGDRLWAAGPMPAAVV